MSARFAILLVLVYGGCVELEPDRPAPGADGSVRDSAQLSDSARSLEATALDASADATIAESAEASSDASSGEAATDNDGPADDGPDAPSACGDRCSRLGDLRCAGAKVVQVCGNAGSCTSWGPYSICREGELCCGGNCARVDGDNCYACDRACEGDAPVCDDAIEACGCSDAACAAIGKICDATSHRCTLDPAHVYVDAAAGRVEDGTPQHPFRSISAALRMKRSDEAVMHVHVAPGRYDTDHGETFPLVLRGVTIEGAGSGQTTIVGKGSYDAHAAGGPVDALVSATVVIGDFTRASALSKVRLYDSVSKPAATSYGIVCDQGNAPSIGVAASPNTMLDQIVVGPGYETGVLVTASTVPQATGCHLQVTSSNVKLFGTGLLAMGCKDPPAAGVSRVAVALRLGNGTKIGGNRFDGRDEGIGVGVRLKGCAARVDATYNVFDYAQGGVEIVQPRNLTEQNHFVFRYNEFNELRQFGLRVAGASAVVDDLSYNRFYSVIPIQYPGLAAGLEVEGLDETYFARIVKATNNTFVDNQVGVRFHSSYPIWRLFEPDDFSGGNVFHCNAAGPNGDPSGIVGGDVVIESPFPGTFHFDDNEWDHAPPTTSTALVADGTDVAGGALVSTAGATAANPPCIRNRP